VQEVVPINSTHQTSALDALLAADSSPRLQLAPGTNPDPGFVDTLVARCAVEPEFLVRDMLTWALTRFPAEVTVPRPEAELRSERAMTRS
jgi:hypothetical protein